MRSLERIVALLPRCSFVRLLVSPSVRPSICLSGTGVHCGHTVYFSAYLSLRLGSPMGTLTPKHVNLSPAVLYQFHLEES